MEKKKKKKTIEIGDHVKEIVASKGSKKLARDFNDPTRRPWRSNLRIIRSKPRRPNSLEKGSDGVQMFKAKRSKLKHYTPRKQLFTKKHSKKGCNPAEKGGSSFKVWKNRVFCSS